MHFQSFNLNAMEYPKITDNQNQIPDQRQSRPEEHKPLSFLKTMLASGLGMLIAFVVLNIIGLFMMIIMLIGITSMGNSRSAYVDYDTFLKIDLTYPISERTPSELQSLMSAENQSVGFVEMLTAINHAATDNHINGIYLYFGTLSQQSWGQAEELRMALEDFKSASGKPVIAYADSYNQSGYYIASVADKIILHPAGQLDWKGIAAQPMFYKDLLDKWDVHMDLIRPANNAYKSAGETYIMNHMSEANKEQVRTYITSIWNHVVSEIANTRNVSEQELNQMADNLSCYDPRNAVAARLVDTLGFEFDAKRLMEADFDMNSLISIDTYSKSIVPNRRRHADKVAVVYAEGDVVTGRGNGIQTAVYGDDVADALDAAADDDDVKAIVLRVNSPGGAVIASEIMTAAVRRANEKKPVIVSMSDVAASAGYEISCNATKIVALPTTLTGSIGVFAAVPEVGDLLKKHLGITTDTVMTNKNSVGISGIRPMSTTTREVMQQSIEDFYQTFIGRVAKGRRMDVAEVDNIARGRVWTGKDALEIGLVDTLGGFSTAVEVACKEADIDPENVTMVEFPAPKSLFDELFGGISDEEYRMKLLGRNNTADIIIEELRYWSNMEPLQARVPFILNIQ